MEKEKDKVIVETRQKECFVCGAVNPMFIWSSSRHFPRDVLIETLCNLHPTVTKQEVFKILKDGVPVCVSCRRVINEIL